MSKSVGSFLTISITDDCFDVAAPATIFLQMRSPTTNNCLKSVPLPVTFVIEKRHAASGRQRIAKSEIIEIADSLKLFLVHTDFSLPRVYKLDEITDTVEEPHTNPQLDGTLLIDTAGAAPFHPLRECFLCSLNWCHAPRAVCESCQPGG